MDAPSLPAVHHHIVQQMIQVYMQVKGVYSVSQKITLKFSGIFPKQLGIFCPNFYVPIMRSYLRSTTNF